MSKINNEVSLFLDKLNPPLRAEIEKLRFIILSPVDGLTENIKWNGPNYCFKDADRITMRIQPFSKIQLIFHRGAKKLEQPNKKLIDDNSGILTWKENDRAIATFMNMEEITNGKNQLIEIVEKWIKAADLE